MSDIDFSKVIELAHEKLEFPKIGNNCVRARCPMCGDSRTKSSVRRFYIDYYPPYNAYIAKCFRCGESLNIVSLYAFLYDCSYTDAKKALEGKHYDPEKIKKKLEKKESAKEQETKQSAELDINIERECYSVDSNPSSRTGKRYVKALKKFQENRKVEGCFVAHSGRYQGRIIIPIYYNGKMIYFQGRLLFDEIEPKYLNPKIDKKDIIMNKDRFKSDLPIIITEGIIDAKMLGYQATTPLEASITDEFIAKIEYYTEEHIILALDNFKKDNASYNVLKKFLENSRFSKKVKYFIFPEEYAEAKDLNDIVKDYEIPKSDMFDLVVNNSYSWLKIEVEIKLRR